MIITDLSIRKVAKDDPRYPDADACKRPDGTVVPFSDVYLCQCTTEDGMEHESAFYVTPPADPLTPTSAAAMLKVFAGAVSRMGQEAKAA